MDNSGNRYPRKSGNRRPTGKPSNNKQRAGKQVNGNSTSRPVSDNYTVDLFHHSIGNQQSQEISGPMRTKGELPSRPGGRLGQKSGGGKTRYGQGGRPSGRPNGRPSGRADSRQGGANKPFVKKGPPVVAARKGYTNYTFELKDDLYKTFTDGLAESGKNPKEIINQLLSFYNMGKIKI